MSVYVDAERPCVPKGRFRWTRSCHMTADTVEELHAMARRIGLRRAWFQPGRPFRNPRMARYMLGHYDLHPARRAVALRLGAREWDPRSEPEMA